MGSDPLRENPEGRWSLSILDLWETPFHSPRARVSSTDRDRRMIRFKYLHGLLISLDCSKSVLCLYRWVITWEMGKCAWTMTAWPVNQMWGNDEIYVPFRWEIWKCVQLLTACHITCCLWVVRGELRIPLNDPWCAGLKMSYYDTTSFLRHASVQLWTILWTWKCV